jgi:hypothetical protein
MDEDGHRHVGAVAGAFANLTSALANGFLEYRGQRTFGSFIFPTGPASIMAFPEA